MYILIIFYIFFCDFDHNDNNKKVKWVKAMLDYEPNGDHLRRERKRKNEARAVRALSACRGSL